MPNRILHSVLALSCLLLLLAATTTTGAQPAAAQQQQQPSPTAAFENGRTLADETLAQLALPEAQLENKPPIGYLIAEGDSWFAYPGLDVLGALKGQTLPGAVYYKVYSAASPGDTVESMAYDADQREGFAEEFQKVVDAGKQREVKAILLSGGGNDIAGKQFHVLLNHARSEQGKKAPLDAAVADAFINRIGLSLESLVGTAARLADSMLGIPRVRIIIHGYGRPVPDGRPFGIGWPLPGPWLEPGFTVKGYPDATPDELTRNTAVMQDLIGKFNLRVSQIPERLKNVADVRYVDLTNDLNNAIPSEAYKLDWTNELHPTKDAFKRVAAAFHRAIQQR